MGRGSSCISDDQEEDQSRNPRRRRAYNGIAGTEHLKVGDDRRVSQRSVELAPPVPRLCPGDCSKRFKAYEKRHADALVATFVPKLRLPPEMIRHVVFYWAHVGFY